MEHEERMKRIRDHFEDIELAIDDLERNLIESGIESIEPAENDDWKMR